MNKRQKNKNLFIRDKKNPYFGLKKGRYMLWKEGEFPKEVDQIRLHQEIFKGVDLLNGNLKRIYLCKKTILGWENWWLAPSTNSYKVIQVTTQHLERLKSEVEGSGRVNAEQKNLFLILSKSIKNNYTSE